MISYRQADLTERIEKSHPTTLIVDLLHTSSGMTVLDHVYEKDKDFSLFPDRKRIYLKEKIRKIMEEKGIWFNRHQNHMRQEGFNNITAIMKKVKEDPRVVSVSENFTIEQANRDQIQHFLFTVVMN